MPSVPEPLARFARAHLRTAAQHAVYRTVGSDPESWWTAAEIADHSGLDVTDIGQALRSFSSCGVLEERVRPADRREYRWQDEIRYVFNDTTPAYGLIDPICGMPVSPDSAYTGHDATGAALRFCSLWCMAAHRARIRGR